MSLRLSPLTAAGLLALGLLDVWLVAVAMEVQGPERETAAPPKAGSPPQLVVTAASPPGIKPIAAYGDTLARPVFHKARLPFLPPPPAPPPVPKVVTTPPPPPPDPGLALAGVMIAGDSRKAYLLSKANAQGQWVQEGDTIMGWTLLAVDAASAKLNQAERSVVLEMYPRR